MKYKDQIQFDHNNLIWFGQPDNEDYRAKLVKNFVCSQTFENYIIPQICGKLDLNATTETKGIQIVGNYDAGKSHLILLMHQSFTRMQTISLWCKVKRPERMA